MFACTCASRDHSLWKNDLGPEGALHLAAPLAIIPTLSTLAYVMVMGYQLDDHYLAVVSIAWCMSTQLGL